MATSPPLLIRVCHAQGTRRMIDSSTDALEITRTIAYAATDGVEHWIPFAQVEEYWIDPRWHGSLVECKYRSSDVADQAKRFWAIVHPDSVGRLLRVMAESK